jgi:NADH-quinone oxidoreductase subunit L
VPLILLAVPSVFIGMLALGPMLYHGFFGEAIFLAVTPDVFEEAGYHGILGFVLHGVLAPPFWLAMAGLGTAAFLYLYRTDIPAKIQARFLFVHTILVNKYGFDEFNDWFFGRGSRGLGGLLWNLGDVKTIDGLMVNGSARAVGWFSGVARKMQTGFLYHYAFAMIIGLLVLLSWFVYS